MKKRFWLLLTILLLVSSTVFAAENDQSSKFGMNEVISKHMTASWAVDGTKYENFTDLGNYVVLLGNYDKSYNLEGAMKIMAKNDTYIPGGCTGTAKLNKKGEVLIAHNMDLDVTQSPAYIFTTTYGKHKTFGVNYVGHDPKNYEQIKKSGKIDDDFMMTIPLYATDVINEAGLYMCTDMRVAYDERLLVSGTNPGKPRASLMSIPQLVAAQCSTVQEAVEFLNNSYDYYSVTLPNINAYAWNMAFLIGDANGEFGLIEVADNEFNYIPYCNGHANYYRTARWNAFDSFPVGFGRFELPQKYLSEPQDIDGMKRNMSRVYYTKCISDVPYAKRDKNGKVRFYDKDGNESLDWRSDYCLTLLKDDNGKYVSDSSEKLPEYINEDLVKYMEALIINDKKVIAEYGDYGKQLIGKLTQTSAKWTVDDANFELVQKEALEANARDKKTENVAKWRAGDEQPLRSAENCWMTSLASGVNCTQKIMKMSFWEKMGACEITFKW